MKPFFAVILLHVNAATWSFGAALPAGADADDARSLTSQISAVTVYADRARVTRLAPVEVRAEATRFAFGQLPGWI